MKSNMQIELGSTQHLVRITQELRSHYSKVKCKVWVTKDIPLISLLTAFLSTLRSKVNNKTKKIVFTPLVLYCANSPSDSSVAVNGQRQGQPHFLIKTQLLWLLRSSEIRTQTRTGNRSTVAQAGSEVSFIQLIEKGTCKSRNLKSHFQSSHSRKQRAD